jgi:hypothetical protein
MFFCLFIFNNCRLKQLRGDAGGVKLGLLRQKINELKEEARIGSISGALKRFVLQIFVVFCIIVEDLLFLCFRKVCRWVHDTFSARDLETVNTLYYCYNVLFFKW